MRKTILHFNNWATTGGVPSFIRDFALTFPEFQHVMCSLNNYEEYDLIKWERDVLMYCYSPKITRQAVEAIDPAIVILHNITQGSMESRWAWDIFYDRRSIAIHHNSTPILGTLVDWFVSNYVRSAYPKSINACRKELIIPPCVYSRPYLNMKRNKRSRVVGRIQSRTRGDSPKEFDEVLSNFNVYKPPIVAGKMADYLKEIDVLAIWQSGTESWSRVATEAIMSGIPVVAFNRNDGLAQQIALTKQRLVNSKEEFIEALNNPVDITYGRDWCLENASEKRLRKELADLFLDWI